MKARTVGLFVLMCMVSLNGQKYVGILYETWFNQLARAGWPPVYPNDVPTSTYRCWGYPNIGGYRSDNTTVIDIHADQLAAAGVDFVILDYSNNNILDSDLNKPLEPLLNLYKSRIDAGKKTPQITFLLPSAENQIQMLWDQAYNGRDTRLFFQYEGRPLLLPMDTCNFNVCSHFTIRPTWALRPNNKWSFMELYPQQIYMNNGVPEQTAVSAAQQQSYMSEPTAHARNFNYKTNQNNGDDGQNFNDQWQYAISKGVKFVVIKSWNEWCSIKVSNGQYTDEFDPNQSNDLEPVRGYFGNEYYNKLIGYISQFKKSANKQ